MKIKNIVKEGIFFFIFCFIFFLIEDWIPGISFIEWDTFLFSSWFFTSLLTAFWKALIITLISLSLFYIFFVNKWLHFINFTNRIKKEDSDFYAENDDDFDTPEDFWIDFYNRKKARSKQDLSLIQKISHELKTPLMIQKSYLKAWEDGLGDSEEAVQIIRNQADRMENKVKQMILFSRVESDYFNSAIKETFYLDELCKEKLASFESLKSPELKFHIESGRIPFYGEKEMWGVVIENLISNQLRYAKNLIWLKLQLDSDKKMILFQSGNDGPVIVEEKLETIFLPFEKDPDGGGSGLGLSIISKIIARAGGEIKAENTAEGPVFTAEIPSGL